jgi:hypothetical protein
MIEMIQLKILLYDDRVTQLLRLLDELHLHITDIIFLHHYYNQHHDIYHDKYQLLVTITYTKQLNK